MKLPALAAKADTPGLRRLGRWGIDQAVVYTLAGRGWTVLAGGFTLLLIPTFFSPEQQGFYYAFANVLNLQIFFELGMSLVIIQFASHEQARLTWTTGWLLEGDPTAKARLSSLLRASLVWYGVAAAATMIGVLPAGVYFFGHRESASVGTSWQAPWLWIVSIFAGLMLVGPVIALLQGCGRVKDIARMQLFQSVASSLCFWLALVRHWGLLAAPVTATVNLLWYLGWLLPRRHFLADLATFRHGGAGISWRGEIWPLQSRLALTWGFGYLIFQLFVPVLFAFHGAVAAGQLGLSISALGSLTTLAMALVDAKAPRWGGLIARRAFKELDRSFFSALGQAWAVAAVGAGTFWAAASYLHHIHHPLGQRLLDPLPLGLLAATTLINIVVFAEAAYLRAHKQEPFLLITIVIGCSVAASTYVLGRDFAATGMMAGYFLINLLVGLGGGTWIFLRKRRLWHVGASE